MRIRLSTILTLAFLMFFSILHGQDRFFTQFYANPLNLNPALTGAIEGSYRVTAGYRDQWNSFVNSPYLTMGAYGDLRGQFGKKKTSDDFYGVGLAFISDRTAVFNLNSNEIHLSGAFHKSLDEYTNQYLSAGFSFGIIQRNINFENLNFDDEFNGLDGFTLGTNENLPFNNFAHGDLSLGINYTISPSKYTSIYAGGAVQHVFSPSVSFFHNTDDIQDEYGDVTLPQKFLFAISSEIGFNEVFAILPRLLYITQGERTMINFGTNVKFDINDYNTNALHIGMGLRMTSGLESMVPSDLYAMVGLEVNSLLIGVSYDYNINDLVNDRLGQSALEISISFIGEYDNDEALCPSF